MHPKFDPIGIRTHELQIMTVHSMSLRRLLYAEDGPDEKLPWASIILLPLPRYLALCLLGGLSLQLPTCSVTRQEGGKNQLRGEGCATDLLQMLLQWYISVAMFLFIWYVVDDCKPAFSAHSPSFVPDMITFLLVFPYLAARKLHICKLLSSVFLHLSFGILLFLFASAHL